MSISILHLTDTHLHSDPDFLMMGAQTRKCLQQVIDHILASDWQADLVLTTGDLVHDETGPAGYRVLQTMLAPLELPVYLLPGNHDCVTSLHDTLNTCPFSTRPQIIFRDWQILLLDSSQAGSDVGHLQPDQFEFLTKHLEDSRLHTLVCLHHQPLPVGSRWLDTMQVDNGAQLLENLQRYPQVKAVLWGHVHQAYDQQHGSLRLLASPSTCKQFKPDTETFSTDDTLGPGYRRLTLHDDGTIETEVIWLAPCENNNG